MIFKQQLFFFYGTCQLIFQSKENHINLDKTFYFLFSVCFICRLFSDRCTMCREFIKDMDMVMRPSTDHYCHASCFRCVTCRRQLNAGDLYSFNKEYGWPYCQIHTMENISSFHQPQHTHNSIGIKNA